VSGTTIEKLLATLLFRKISRSSLAHNQSRQKMIEEGVSMREFLSYLED
jgi:hypothetical protein